MHKILLVEDDAVIRQQVKKMLEQWGFEVVAVEDFMQVLTIFVKEEPHLVLMDIGLPLFNGYHWCHYVFVVKRPSDGYCHGYQYGWRRFCHQTI